MNIKVTAALLSVLSFFVAAQEPSKFKQLLAMDLGDMLKVEVATGTAKQLAEAPAIVSVVTRKDIELSGAKTLAEAVERVPGLHVAASINRMNSLFAIRGIQTDNTTQVLVLIDGVEISEITSFPIPYAFRLPTNFIERIEIIRGPGSAVYGADAFSGVINVITKTPGNEDELEIGMSAGNFDYLETWLNTSQVFDKFKIGASFTYEKQNNDDMQTTPYGVMQRNREVFNAHVNVVAGQFEFKNWYWKNRQKMGVGAGIFGNDIDLDISRAWKLQLNWNGTITENIDASVEVSNTLNSYNAYFQLFPPGIWPVGSDGNVFQPPFIPVSFPNGVIGHPRGKNNNLKFKSSFVYSGIMNHRLRLGFGAKRSDLKDVEETKNFGPGVLDTANLPANLVSTALVDVSGTDFVYTPNYERDIWHVSIQDEWKFAEDWELTIGLRHDNYSDFGSTTNPRLALVWRTNPKLTSKFLFGTAFRAPKVAELAFVNNPTTLGNPDLDPEKIQTTELAFDYRPSKNFTGSLNIFTYQSEDLIQQDTSFVYLNIGEQDGRGLEVESTWQISEQFRLSGNLSWLDSDLPLTGEDKAQVPGFMAFLEFQYRLASNMLLTNQNYLINDRKRQANDLRPEVDDYIKSDVTFLWQYNPNIEITLGIKNLFNDDIIEPVVNSALFAIGLGFPGDYPRESRSMFAGIKIDL